MTQIATVEKIIDPTHVKIAVPRKSACGHDCEECAGCGMTGAAIKAKAKNKAGAQPGQKVIVESSTQKMLGIVTLVYCIPIVLFLLGYLLPALSGAAVAVQYTLAIIGFVAGVFFAILYDRKLRAKGGLTFTIVKLL